MNESDLKAYRAQLGCSFEQIDHVFEGCMREAELALSSAGIRDYLDGASLICMTGWGVGPVLEYIEEMPQVVERLGDEAALSLVSQTVWKMSRSPNGRSIPAFLQTIAEAARRLGSMALMQAYCQMVLDFMERTSTSIHGNQGATIASPGLEALLEQMPSLLHKLSLPGLRNWIEYGLQHYPDHPDRQREYFGLQTADSVAVLARERHGTLYVDHERQLDIYLRAFWGRSETLMPYSAGLAPEKSALPYFDDRGIRIPDVYDDVVVGLPPSNSPPRGGGEGDGRRPSGGTVISGIDRYRALLAHIEAHKRWSTPQIAENYSPLQRMAIEVFEDCRIEQLLIRTEYPGLRRLWLGLHPLPAADVPAPGTPDHLAHRLLTFSRATLEGRNDLSDPLLRRAREQFENVMAKDAHTTGDIVSPAISLLAALSRESSLDPAANPPIPVEVGYRDDNRHLWHYFEEDEDPIEHLRQPEDEQETDRLPPRHYPEWDYKAKTYRPDWISLYEGLHPSGEAARIDRLLAKHRGLAKQLKRILDMIKPQQYVRVRYQEDGSELDLDVAIRSLIDFKSGAQPDPRINMSHRHDGRDIAVMLLLDLSQSLNETVPGSSQTILELSQEAVSLLAWAVEHLGDEFAIAGFNSDTRHEVRYQHIKGYTEHWDDTVKGRLAAMQAGFSTRMGAAMRHAAHYLEKRQVDKKLMLILTDGEPHDIDEQDPRQLIEDAHKAVQELDRKGIFTFCVNLDPKADEYVQDIFGRHYTVIDRVERLPQKLPELFLSLTR